MIALGAWLAYQLVLQNGRILLRLESIEKRLPPRKESKQREGGLPFGAVAPDFELPDLTGVRHKLSEFRGRNVLLLFFNPSCGSCTKMAADLAALPLAGGDQQALPIVVTTGDLEQNRKLVAQYGIRCLVLRQEQMEVASQFRAQGTPMGYRIDAAGRIASGLAVGAKPLLQLASAPELHQLKPAAKSNDSAAHGHQPDPSLARSKLNRSGLKAGAEAPEFRLLRIDGGELSLADFRGQRLLLVFSDPNCGPCDELAPGLQQLHTERADVQVLVISRRDMQATRAKAGGPGAELSHHHAEAMGSLPPVRDVCDSDRLPHRRAGRSAQRCRRRSRACGVKCDEPGPNAQGACVGGQCIHWCAEGSADCGDGSCTGLGNDLTIVEPAVTCARQRPHTATWESAR